MSELKLNCLDGSTWIDDKIIDACGRLLSSQYPSINGLQDALIVGSKWQRTIITQGQEEAVQLMNIRNCHWICLHFRHSTSTVKIYDSLHPYDVTSPPPSALQELCQTIFPSASRCVYSPCQLQKDSNDCGAFSLAFAECLCRGEDPATLQFQQSAMRMHLLQCLAERRIRPFPTVKYAFCFGICLICNQRLPHDHLYISRLVLLPAYYA